MIRKRVGIHREVNGSGHGSDKAGPDGRHSCGRSYIVLCQSVVGWRLAEILPADRKIRHLLHSRHLPHEPSPVLHGMPGTFDEVRMAARRPRSSIELAVNSPNRHEIGIGIRAAGQLSPEVDPAPNGLAVIPRNPYSYRTGRSITSATVPDQIAPRLLRLPAHHGGVSVTTGSGSSPSGTGTA